MRTMQHTAVILVALVGVTLLAVPAHAQMQMDWGVRGGIYSDDSDPFIGIEVLMPLMDQVDFNPNIEFMFGDNRDLLSVNADFVWRFPPQQQFDLWAGAGPALLIIDRENPFGSDDSDTEFGLNLLAGVSMRTTMAFRPYLQGKVIIADDSEGVIAIGARF